VSSITSQRIVRQRYGDRRSCYRPLAAGGRVCSRVVAVASGKGGVGKTNIAANLAICLALSEKKVVLWDADLSLGNVDVLLGVESRYNISHILDGRKSIEEIVQVGPAGVEMICGASGLEKLADLSEFQRQRLLEILFRLQSESDFIVIDTAAGISRSVVGFCLSADHVLVATTPQATAMTDAYALIKVLAGNGHRGRISLVVNMAQSKAEGKRIYQQIAKVARRFLDVPVYDAGVLMADECLRAAVRMRKAVVLAYPKARISLSLASLAARLSRCSAARVEEAGFFKKVVNWFF